jgi:hypothetical protein
MTSRLYLAPVSHHVIRPSLYIRKPAHIDSDYYPDNTKASVNRKENAPDRKGRKN